MSDREAFEKWANAALSVAGTNGMSDDQVIPTWPEGVDGPELTIGMVKAALSANGGEAERLREELDDMKRLFNTAMEIAEFPDAHPAPPSVAVPEGWKLVPVKVTREMCEAAAKQRRCVVSSNLYATIREAILAAPQPDGTVTDYGTKSDHSPDAGKVVHGEPVAVLRCSFDETGCVKDHWLDWKVGAEDMKDLMPLYTHPAESREEIQALALEEFADELCPTDLLKAIPALAERLDLAASGARAKAARLRASQQECNTAGDDGEGV